MNKTLKWLSSLPNLMEGSFWSRPCSDRYIISLVCLCVYVFVCVCVCVRAFVYVCVCVCVLRMVCGQDFSLYKYFDYYFVIIIATAIMLGIRAYGFMLEKVWPDI